MSIPYILFYSNGCNHSTEIINAIKSQPIGSNVKYFCIDGYMTLPDYIQFTPTMRIIKQGERYILTGEEIYTWLESVSPSLQSSTQIQKQKQNKKNQNKQTIQYSSVPEPEPEPELQQISYQTTNDVSNDLDNVFGEQNMDNAEAELDAMFKNKPISTRMITSNNDLQSRMEAMENERSAMDKEREQKLKINNR